MSSAVSTPVKAANIAASINIEQSPVDESSQESAASSSQDEYVPSSQESRKEEPDTPADPAAVETKKAMPVKMQVSKLKAITTHKEFIDSRPAPHERKGLRLKKNLQLHRWQYVLKHPGICTFAGMDANMEAVLAPGLTWIVDGDTLTVVAPYVLSGGPFSVVLCKEPLLRRLVDGVYVDRGPEKAKALVFEELHPSHTVSMTVCDIFRNGTPYPTVDVVFYDRANEVIDTYLAKYGKDAASWKIVEEARVESAARKVSAMREKQALQEQLKLKKKRAEDQKKAAQQKKLALKQAAAVKRKRLLAAKKAAETRKRRKKEKEAAEKEASMNKQLNAKTLVLIQDAVKEQVKQVCDAHDVRLQAVQKAVQDTVDSLRKENKSHENERNASMKVLSAVVCDVKQLKSEMIQAQKVAKEVLAMRTVTNPMNTLMDRCPPPRVNPAPIAGADDFHRVLNFMRMYKTFNAF